MSSVIERCNSVRAAIDAMRNQVSASDWQAGQLLRVMGDLADVIAEHVDDTADTVSRKDARGDRESQLQRLLYLAVRSLPAEVRSGSGRDREVVRILCAWGVQSEEIHELGYK